PRELLRRVVGGVRAGDRDRLRTELRRAPADVGLGMAALAPPLLRELAGELLGHPPRAADLGRLRGELDGRVRDLLPGLPPPVLETLLTRVCRMPPPRASGEPPHAADSAVTAGVATGLLLARLGRDLPANPDPRPGGAGQPGAGPQPTGAGQPARVGKRASGAGQRPGSSAAQRSGGLPPRTGSPWRDAPTRRGSDG
ncbi:hypothetical protein FHG89_30720, partial [Micromonospora orduensis]